MLYYEGSKNDNSLIYIIFVFSEMEEDSITEDPPPSYNEVMSTAPTDVLTIYLLEKIMEIMELILELLNI